MTSRERIVHAARREPTDILPVAPYMGNFGTAAAGYHLKDCYTNGKKLAEAQTIAWELFGQDVLVVQSDNYYMAEAFGCTIAYHEDSTPTLENPVIETLADVTRLAPADPLKDGRMHVYLEAIAILKKRFKHEVAIRGCGTGPFVMAGHLMGTERFMFELAQAHYGMGGDEKAILAIMEIACETLISFAARQLELGATIVQCADSTASLDMISPEMYEKYVFPFEKRFFAAIKPLCVKYDAVSLLHICGNNAKVFHLYAQTGADIVAVDHKADLSFAKGVMGDRVCVIGNLDPTSVLLQGSQAEVEKAVRSCIEKAAPGGGYIIGSGCEVAVKTPHENIKTVIRIAREYSYQANENSLKL